MFLVFLSLHAKLVPRVSLAPGGGKMRDPGNEVGFTLGFYFAYLYILISHVRKELSHSDWLFVCKLKTNP